MSHENVCLKINGQQSVKLKSGSIKFNNFFKQLGVSFKIYTNFESVLKVIKSNNRSNNTSYNENYQKHIPCSFAYKDVCVNDRPSEPVVTEEKMQ